MRAKAAFRWAPVSPGLMGGTDSLPSMNATPSPTTCQNCGGDMVPTDVEDQLFVRRRGEGRRDGWSASQLDSFTCTTCGRTDLYASDPDRLRGDD